jgi:hypothetical protein
VPVCAPGEGRRPRQLLSRSRQPGLARGAIEERHAELAFEVGDAIADRGLRAMQGARCGGETPGVDHGHEETQLIEGEGVDIGGTTHRMGR